MNVIVFRRILAKLNGDATLLALLGVQTLDPSDPPIFRSQRSLPTKIPSVTLKDGSTSKYLFPGSNIASTVVGAQISRDVPNFEVHVWVGSGGGLSPDGLPYPQNGDDADAIVDRINVLLVLDSTNWVTGTHSWQSQGSPQQYEVDTNLWHNVIRCQFEYFMKQGFVPE